MSDNNFEQGLKDYGMQCGGPFIIKLLMKEKCDIPDKDTMNQVMEKYLGDVEQFSDEGFAVKKYSSHFQDKSVPPMLLIMGCMERNENDIDALSKSQMWDCPNHESILEECRYQVIANDMMAAGMNYKERAEMLMDFSEALLELYPDCEAIFFESSGKMFSREDFVNADVPREDRFIYYAVNVRFFRIEGTDDMLVDTLGMGTIFMPDLQYHFHGMDPNQVVNHAYNMLSYIYDKDCPIKSGDVIDGIKDGKMSYDVQWKCRYEQSLIQPVREVLDVCMNEYASGTRD